MIRTVALLAALTTLAACGSTTRLRPSEGMEAVPKAAAADRIETAAELMTPGTQAQPDRRADLLIRSSERADDPFALPPGSDNGRPVRTGEQAPPAPENTANDRNTTGQGLPKSIDATDDRPDDPNAPVPAPAAPQPDQ